MLLTSVQRVLSVTRTMLVGSGLIAVCATIAFCLWLIVIWIICSINPFWTTQQT
jgi:hypothetical protein